MLDYLDSTGISIAFGFVNLFIVVISFFGFFNYKMIPFLDIMTFYIEKRSQEENMREAISNILSTTILCTSLLLTIQFSFALAISSNMDTFVNWCSFVACMNSACHAFLSVFIAVHVLIYVFFFHGDNSELLLKFGFNFFGFKLNGLYIIGSIVVHLEFSVLWFFIMLTLWCSGQVNYGKTVATCCIIGTTFVIFLLEFSYRFVVVSVKQKAEKVMPLQQRSITQDS